MPGGFLLRRPDSLTERFAGVVAAIGRGHDTFRVEPIQHRFGNLGKLVDLAGVERVDDVLADVRDVSLRSVLHQLPPGTC
jgi:hypothetical protein